MLRVVPPLPTELCASDHASLFFMSSVIQELVEVDGSTSNAHLPPLLRTMAVFPFNPGESPVYRGAATDIYKTKDGRFYHVHGKALSARTGIGPDGVD